MKFIYDDGGRAAAGYHGETSDCVVRAIAIAAELPYQQVYDAINDAAKGERKSRRKRGVSNARTGVYKQTIRRYLTSLGWQWTPMMLIGSGCKVHLADGELPMGRLIVSVSKHIVAVIDGVIHDTGDPQREPTERMGVVKMENGWQHNVMLGMTGGRCVYGYWRKA